MAKPEGIWRHDATILKYPVEAQVEGASMLDVIRKMASEFLGISLKEVRETRDALYAEVASEDGRYGARTQLTHPEGSITPLNDAADRAQQAFAKIRGALENELPKVMRLLLAYDVAQQRRDEAQAARDRHWDTEMARRTSGLHPKVGDYFRRLFMHGATPHNLAQHSDEDVAIVADLHRWKAADPRYLDPDNPWAGVYNIYANRLIAVPGRGQTVKRSTAGTPVRTKRYAADKWYMFNEIAAKIAGVPATPTLTMIPAQAAQPPFDTGLAVTPVASPDTVSIVAAPAAPAPQDTVAEPEAAVDSARAIGNVKDDAKAGPEAGGADDISTPEAQPKLSYTRARSIAEAMHERESYRIGIFWPKEGVARDDYTPETLIPALQRWVASDDNWIGAEHFLAAALEGRAREFIDGKRDTGISRLALALIEGDEKEMTRARALGLVS